jgi:lipid-A-disaccharide synthase
MQFLLSAGEASGDTYGAQLAQALQRLAPGSTFFGMGGEKMRAAGCDLLVHANEVAVVGLVEVVTHLPAIRRRFKHLVAEAARRKPDAAVLIDFPDFNLRLARELHGLGIPVFYFVSPQIWAWRTGRVKQIKKYVSKMIVIFPFEQEFYRRHGVEVSYVGHPLAYAAATLFGITASALRMAFGGHFFTDVAAAGLVSFLVIWLAYAFIYRWPATRMTDAQVEAGLARLASPWSRLMRRWRPLG